jgi:glyoxylase-like metal-dependent hydrolase (beta-lactamase superfamily II)
MMAVPIGAAQSAGVNRAAGQVTAYYRFKLGTFTVTALSDGFLTLPSPLLATNVAEPELKGFVRANYIGDDQFRAQITAVVIDTGDHLVLVDAGGGGRAQATTGLLMAGLEGAGIDPADIDRLVLTHAHPDHLWGAVGGGGEIRFASARHIISDAEWAFWMNPPDLGFPERWRGMVEGNQNAFRAIADRIERIKPGVEVVTGIATIDTPGHTPGHMSVHVASDGEELVITGDAITHAVLSFAHPDWHSGFDGDRDKAVATRRRLMDLMATDRPLVLGYHFPFPGVGHVAREGDAYRWVSEQWRWSL